MEKTELNQILDALKLHGEQVSSKFDEMEIKVNTRIDKLEKQMNDRFEKVDKHFEQIDDRFEQVDKRFDRVDDKLSGLRVDLSDTQKTVDYLRTKAQAPW
ncbi:hypothetical protein [Aquibacillus albus]|uniref:Archaellum component FlaC n=1 Tax=Aquibacillus albus TaxID=1168171 RepID=A0ABS2N0U5_9BACI|nr:hypothetical protein [Aquibacillus albus]MBM7571673.1 archaellum component FlaC [Aquibacillus albus]